MNGPKHLVDEYLRGARVTATECAFRALAFIHQSSDLGGDKAMHGSDYAEQMRKTYIELNAQVQFLGEMLHVLEYEFEPTAAYEND